MNYGYILTSWTQLVLGAHGRIKNISGIKNVISFNKGVVRQKSERKQSSLMGINVRQDDSMGFAEIMECQTQNWPLNYLTLPLGGKSNPYYVRTSGTPISK